MQLDVSSWHRLRCCDPICLHDVLCQLLRSHVVDPLIMEAPPPPRILTRGFLFCGSGVVEQKPQAVTQTLRVMLEDPKVYKKQAELLGAAGVPSCESSSSLCIQMDAPSEGIGIPAFQSGTAMRVETPVVGMDEALSMLGGTTLRTGKMGGTPSEIGGFPLSLSSTYLLSWQTLNFLRVGCFMIKSGTELFSVSEKPEPPKASQRV